jgi:hypothetical protein
MGFADIHHIDDLGKQFLREVEDFFTSLTAALLFVHGGVSSLKGTRRQSYPRVLQA